MQHTSLAHLQNNEIITQPSQREQLDSIRNNLAESKQLTGLNPIIILDLDDTTFLQTPAIRNVVIHSIWNEVQTPNKNNETLEYFQRSIDTYGLLKTLTNTIPTEEIPDVLEKALTNPVTVNFIRSLPVHATVPVLIDSLKEHFDVVLLTLSNPALVHHKLRLLGIPPESFTSVACLNKGAKTSDDFKEVLSSIGWKKESGQQVVTVGNSIENDLLPALEYSNHTILVTSQNTYTEHVAVPDITFLFRLVPV